MTDVPTGRDLDEAARKLYDECVSVKPSWDQIGEVSRGVWRDYVTRGHRRYVREPKPKNGEQESLW